MEVYEHHMPFNIGETVKDGFPKSHDPRFQPFFDALTKAGVIGGEDGDDVLKPFKMKRGFDSNGWIMRLEINEG